MGETFGLEKQKDWGVAGVKLYISWKKVQNHQKKNSFYISQNKELVGLMNNLCGDLIWVFMHNADDIFLLMEYGYIVSKFALKFNDKFISN